MKNGIYVLGLLFCILVSCKKQEQINRNLHFNEAWEQITPSSEIDISNFSHHSEKQDGLSGHNSIYYRNSISINPAQSERVYIWFDSLNFISTYWLNGHRFNNTYSIKGTENTDLGRYVKANGQPNEIVIKVDAKPSAFDAKLLDAIKVFKVNKLHIPMCGTDIEITESDAESMEIQLMISMNNVYANHQTAQLITNIYDTDGKLLEVIEGDNCICKPGLTRFLQFGNIQKSVLKNQESDFISTTSVLVNDVLYDQYTTRFSMP